MYLGRSAPTRGCFGPSAARDLADNRGMAGFRAAFAGAASTGIVRLFSLTVASPRLVSRAAVSSRDPMMRRSNFGMALRSGALCGRFCNGAAAFSCLAAVAPLGATLFRDLDDAVPECSPPDAGLRRQRAVQETQPNTSRSGGRIRRGSGRRQSVRPATHRGGRGLSVEDCDDAPPPLVPPADGVALLRAGFPPLSFASPFFLTLATSSSRTCPLSFCCPSIKQECCSVLIVCSVSPLDGETVAMTTAYVPSVVKQLRSSWVSLLLRYDTCAAPCDRSLTQSFNAIRLLLISAA